MKTYLSALVALIRKNPVRTWAVVRSVGIAVLAFWPGLLTPDQIVALVGIGVALFGVDEAVRSQVTPVVAPKLEPGTPVNDGDAVVLNLSRGG